MAPPLDQDAFHRARLVVHEWLANLIQHARFEERIPTITVQVRITEFIVHYIIEDNSEGFDLEARLGTEARQEAFPERGFGLQIIRACTEALTYRPLERGGHRLAFYIAPRQDPQVILPLVGSSEDRSIRPRLVA
ncbi:MAG: ATP-binding protein [Rhodothermales bacterium]